MDVRRRDAQRRFEHGVDRVHHGRPARQILQPLDIVVGAGVGIRLGAGPRGGARRVRTGRFLLEQDHQPSHLRRPLAEVDRPEKGDVRAHGA